MNAIQQYERYCQVDADKKSVGAFRQASYTGVACVLLGITTATTLVAADLNKAYREPRRISPPRAPELRQSVELAKSRRRLGVNMSDFALLLGVSRPTAYAWVEGKQNPQPEKFRAIDRVNALAEAIEAEPIPRFDLWIKRPVLDGQSLLERFLAGEDINAHLAAIRTRALAESDARARPKGFETMNTRRTSFGQFSPTVTED
jgi:DNA-binding transcriptional regulator YiaG